MFTSGYHRGYLALFLHWTDKPFAIVVLRTLTVTAVVVNRETVTSFFHFSPSGGPLFYQFPSFIGVLYPLYSLIYEGPFFM